MVIGLREKEQKAVLMSEVVPDPRQEFWRPPIIAQAMVSNNPAQAIAARTVGSCAACHTEFMSRSRFCYVCGAARKPATNMRSAWTRHLSFLRVLGFQHIRQGLGLPMPSLVGFFAGLGCLVAALAV